MNARQLALESLKRLSSKFGTDDNGIQSDWTEWADCRQAIASLEFELSQPEAWMAVKTKDEEWAWEPVYAAPRSTT